MSFAPVEPGRMLGRFQLEAKLGSGGMGEVYRALDTKLGRSVAIKVLRSGGAIEPEHLRRFEKEARAASALNHPHIVTVYDAGMDGDIPWIAMELVQGRTVRDVLADGPLPRPQLFSLGIAISEALATAHDAGIIHRDLKPENVMICPDGTPKILDFGLAKLTAIVEADNAETEIMTNAGLVKGTLGYMSPEQLLGKPVDQRTDQFSFGVMLYEMATGVHPFRRDTATQTMAAILETQPDCKIVPAQFAVTLARCLQKDPALRFSSTRDMAAALKGSSSPRAFRTTVFRKQRWALAGLTVLLALGGLGWVLYRWKPAKPVVPVIAVRPFKNLSPDPAQEYFSSGLAEELRSRLNKISSIRLLSRTVVEAYKFADSRRLALDLGATKVIEGTVRADKDRVRVSVELIDARTQQTLWSDQFDRRLNDLLSVQADIALRVADALQTSLSPDERRQIAQRPTQNAAAYDLYLQALNYTRRAELDSRARTINLLKQAVDLDPRFAQAMAEISYNLIFIADPRDADEALRWAQRAVDIDPQSAEAQQALGLANASLGFLTKARVSLLRAIELASSQSPYLSNLSEIENELGKFDQSLRWARAGVERNPTHPSAYYHVALPLSMLSSHGEFERWMAIWKERYGSFPRVKVVEAYWRMQRGQLGEALREAQDFYRLRPNYLEIAQVVADLSMITGADDAETLYTKVSNGVLDPVFLNREILPESGRVRLAWFHLHRGDKSEGERLLNDAERVAMEQWRAGVESAVVPMELAAIHTQRGDTKGALEWLETAYGRGWRRPEILRLDPMLSGVRNEPQFQALLQRINGDLRRMEQQSPDIPELFEKTAPNLPPLVPK